MTALTTPYPSFDVNDVAHFERNYETMDFRRISKGPSCARQTVLDEHGTDVLIVIRSDTVNSHTGLGYFCRTGGYATCDLTQYDR